MSHRQFTLCNLDSPPTDRFEYFIRGLFKHEESDLAMESFYFSLSIPFHSSPENLAGLFREAADGIEAEAKRRGA